MIAVTPAEPDHVGAIAALLEEMDRFYGATDVQPPHRTAPQITDGLFGDRPAASALLAWDGSSLVGLAAYSYLWPAVGVTRSLYLKELYVAQAARRRGVGRLLMRALFEVAANHGCSRVEWTTDNDNPDAMRFYAALGLAPYPSKVFYRLQGQDLLRAAEPATSTEE